MWFLADTLQLQGNLSGNLFRDVSKTYIDKKLFYTGSSYLALSYSSPSHAMRSIMSAKLAKIRPTVPDISHCDQNHPTYCWARGPYSEGLHPAQARCAAVLEKRQFRRPMEFLWWKEMERVENAAYPSSNMHTLGLFLSLEKNFSFSEMTTSRKFLFFFSSQRGREGEGERMHMCKKLPSSR